MGLADFRSAFEAGARAWSRTTLDLIEIAFGVTLVKGVLSLQPYAFGHRASCLLMVHVSPPDQ